MSVGLGWLATALGIAALGQLGFVLLYLTVPWWNSMLGRVLFFMAVALLATLSAASVGLRWDWRHEYEVLFVFFSLLAAATWIQTFAFFAVRREAAQHERDYPQFPETGWGSR